MINYRTVLDHLEELMPIIYTSTVGRARQEYRRIFRRPRGMFISIRDAGHICRIFRNWPCRVSVRATHLVVAAL